MFGWAIAIPFRSQIYPWKDSVWINSWEKYAENSPDQPWEPSHKLSYFLPLLQYDVYDVDSAVVFCRCRVKDPSWMSDSLQLLVIGFNQINLLRVTSHCKKATFLRSVGTHRMILFAHLYGNFADCVCGYKKNNFFRWQNPCPECSSECFSFPPWNRQS